MIDFRNILNPSCTRANLFAASKKAVIEDASELIAQHHPQVDARRLLEELLARERLGSTALGSGVAIPHCRLHCDRPVAALIRLQRPIDFDALDEGNVDLLFVLAVPVPEDQLHLDILAMLAHVFYHAPNLVVLRRAEDDERLFDAFMQMVDHASAA